MKTEKEFEVYPDSETKIMAKAIFIDGVYQAVKLITKVGRSHYNHFINDAGKTAEELFLN